LGCSSTPSWCLGSWAGIGRKERRPCCEKKVGQQSGGQDVLLDGFPKKSVESVMIASNHDIGRADEK
jgi:hypothetical protein